MVLNDLNPFGNQKAVYGSSDVLWVMFFAIKGMIYLLPWLTFIDQPPMTFGEMEVQIAQLASLSPVEPLARVPVSPADFPFLDQVRPHDDQRLREYAAALQTGAPLPG